MKAIFIIFTALLTFKAASNELSSADLSTLSECDYFKYTVCTKGGLNIGACIKAKNKDFVKACGGVHAEKYTYSREMFKPTIDPKKKGGKKCEEAQDKLCGKSGQGLSQCVKKNAQAFGAACGEDFVKGATSKAVMQIDECFKLRKKACGNEVDPDCDASFEASAPSVCKGVSARSKSAVKGSPSEKTLMNDCYGNIEKKCKLDEEALMKDGANVKEIVKKFQECSRRALKASTGKCGKHFEVDSVVKKKKAEKK